MKLHEKIKYLRKQKGFSQQKLASLADIHITNVSRLENDHYKPSFDLLKKLVDIFEVSADYLMDDEMEHYEEGLEGSSLSKQIRMVDSLEENEKKAISEVIEAMLIKKKMRELVNTKKNSI